MALQSFLDGGQAAEHLEPGSSEALALIATKAEPSDADSADVVTTCCGSDDVSPENVLAPWEFWGYTLVIPLVCTIGIVSNTLSLTVMRRVKFKESLYVYLQVLSAVDLVTVTLILFSAVCTGTEDRYYWLRWIDVFIYLPIGSFTATISILTLMAVTLERLLVIRFTVNSLSYRTKSTAGKVCTGISVFSFFFNIPYFSSFYMSGWEIKSSEFTQTLYYDIHNWIRFILLGVIPGVFLLFGNILFINYLSKYHRNYRRRIKNNLTTNSCTTAANLTKSKSHDPIVPHVGLGSIYISPIRNLNYTLGRRYTLGTVTDTEVLVRIDLSKKTDIREGNYRVCNMTEERFTLDLKDASLCLNCTRLKDSRIADHLNRLQCCCDGQQKSLSMPLLTKQSSEEQQTQKDKEESEKKSRLIGKEEVSGLTSSGFGGSSCPEDDISYPEIIKKEIERNADTKSEQGRRRRQRLQLHHQRRVTLVLVAVICSFLIGETPSHLASRSTIYTFSSDEEMRTRKSFKIFKLLATLLMSMHYSGNFFFYLGLNKRFADAIKQIFRGWSAVHSPNSGSMS